MSIPNLFISTSGRVDEEAVNFLNKMFFEAAVHKVADIQLRFFSYEHRIEVQSISDVVSPLLDYGDLEGIDWYELIDSKIRSKASLDVADNVRPLDGRMRLIYKKEDGWDQDISLDIRISILPTNIGQTIVLRIQRGAEVLLPFEQLEMTDAIRELLRDILSLGQGLVIVCGPTGSGKTTLLFSLLLELLKAGKNIKTIEDPVEYTVDGIDQVSRTMYLNFAQALSAFLRQHPHVILVGEIRDKESAEAAVQAARTGHLVFSTVHADSAADSFLRLRDLGVDSNTLSDSLKAVIGQRLLRAFSADEDVLMGPPTDMEKFKLEQLGLYHPGEQFPQVGNSPMKGRVPLMEVISIDQHIKKALANPRFMVEDICKAASMQPQYQSLIEGHVRLARQGRTVLKGFDAHPLYLYHTERIDQVLLKRGHITPEESYKMVDGFAQSLGKGIQKTLWEVAIDLGMVSLEQIFAAVGSLPSSAQRLQFYIENRLITKEVASECIKEFMSFNYSTSIFEIVKEQTGLSDEQIYDKKILYYWSPDVSAVS